MKYEVSQIVSNDYLLLDLDQREVELKVMADMDAGVEVYYDRRWEVTAYLTSWLEDHHAVYAGKRVLVIGAGVGIETAVIGRLAQKLFINDLSPVALELCSAQLEKNGVDNFAALLGRYEEIELPEVDLIVASFLVYNKETLGAMRKFMSENNCSFILMNENLPDFVRCLKEIPNEILFEEEGAMCVMFKDGSVN